MTRREPSPSSARTITLRVELADDPDVPATPGGSAPERLHDPDAVPDPPRDVAGAPVLRDRDTLHALLSREAAWVRAHLPAALAAVGDQDPRWLADPELDAAVMGAWSGDEERGIVRVWPEELARLVAEDLPQGAGVCVEGEVDSVLRRGVGRWPLAIEFDLGAARLGWTRTLDVAAYTSLVHAAAANYAARRGGLDIAYDARGATGPYGVVLRVRVRCTATSAADAFRSAYGLRAILREPADVVERAARHAIGEMLEELRG